MEYGQFCPIAKASEIIGEKWTVLVIRELLMGATRFSELQRGLGLISPTLLSRRLDSLVQHGLVMKKKIPGQKGHEYLATQSCKELLPVIRSLGDWGMCWARSSLTERDYDVELLMLYLQRSVVPENLPGTSTTLRFKFTDIKAYPDWWILVEDGEVDCCTVDPGKEVDVYFTSTVKILATIWMGESSYKKAVRDGDLALVGDRVLTSNISHWMTNSMFADLPPAKEI